MGREGTSLRYPATLDMRKFSASAAMNDDWPGCTLYQLAGVLVHGGTASHGHYVYFQRVNGGQKDEVWLVRNDDQPVWRVGRDEALAQGTSACALVYYRHPPTR